MNDFTKRAAETVAANIMKRFATYPGAIDELLAAGPENLDNLIRGEATQHMTNIMDACKEYLGGDHATKMQLDSAVLAQLKWEDLGKYNITSIKFEGSPQRFVVDTAGAGLVLFAIEQMPALGMKTPIKSPNRQDRSYRVRITDEVYQLLRSNPQIIKDQVNG